MSKNALESVLGYWLTNNMCGSYMITHTMAEQDRILHGKGMIQLPCVIYHIAVTTRLHEHGIRKQKSGPSYYPRRVPNNGYVNPAWSREQIDRFIRAMYFPPFKGACVRLVDGGEVEISALAEYDALVASERVKSES